MRASPSTLLALLQLPQLPLLALTLPVELPESEPDSHTALPPRLSGGPLRRERVEHWPGGQWTELSEKGMEPQSEGGVWVNTNRSAWGHSLKSAQVAALPLLCRCSSGSYCGFRWRCARWFSSRVCCPSLEQPGCALERCCGKTDRRPS